MKTFPNLIRIFTYTFFPRRCWACFAPDSEIRTRYEYYEESWGCVEAEWECGRCHETVAEKHYSPVYPNHPTTVLGRVQFLQEELSRGTYVLR